MSPGRGTRARSPHEPDVRVHAQRLGRWVDRSDEEATPDSPQTVKVDTGQPGDRRMTLHIISQQKQHDTKCPDTTRLSAELGIRPIPVGTTFMPLRLFSSFIF